MMDEYLKIDSFGSIILYFKIGDKQEIVLGERQCCFMSSLRRNEWGKQLYIDSKKKSLHLYDNWGH